MEKHKEQLFNPIEVLATVAGVVIVAIGVPVSQQQGYLSFAGNLLAVIGALLSSAVGAWVIARKQSTHQLREQLASIQRHLHTSISKMQTAVSEGLDAEIGDERLALTKIQEQTDSLKVILADISSISGMALDLERANMSKIISEIKELQNTINHAVETEEDENDRSAATDTVLAELQKKVTHVMSEVSKIPGHSKTPITNPAPILTKQQRWLASIRKLNMQHLGADQQPIVISAIHKVASQDITPKQSPELAGEILKELQLIYPEGNYTKTKVSGVFRIFTFAEAFGVTPETRDDGTTVPHYSLKDEFAAVEKFSEIHNLCLACFADHFKVSEKEIAKQLAGMEQMQINRANGLYKRLRGKVESYFEAQ